MATAAPTPVAPDEWTDWSLADLQAHLDDIPLERIRLNPQPGRATEEDALLVRERTGSLCELVDGILVEPCEDESADAE